jgi:hypothetical protein
MGIRCAHLLNSSNHCFCNRKIKLRSRSFRVVYSSISACGLSVVRPRDDPLRSNLLWIVWSEQNRFPIMTKRTWVALHQQANNQDASQQQIHKQGIYIEWGQNEKSSHMCSFPHFSEYKCYAFHVCDHANKDYILSNLLLVCSSQLYTV